MATLAREERLAFQDSVRRLLADRSTEADVRRTMELPEGYDPALWRQLAELGVVGLLIDEAHGGTGAGPMELELVMEEAGAALLCGPLLSSGVLAAGLLQALGDTDAQGRLLPRIADGSVIATAAITGPSGTWTRDGVAVTASDTGNGWSLDGEASYVTDGQIAGVVLVAANAPDGLAVFEVEAKAPGVATTALPTFDHTLRLAQIRFARAPARRLMATGAAWDAVEQALDLARVALAGEQAGAGRRVLDFTVDYAKARVQFGRAIGSFQAIKHMAADLLLEAESSVSAARHAAQALAEGAADRDAAISLAAFACADAFSTITATAVQMHGGIAFTWAHPAHLYLRRARADAQLFGTPAFYRERYVQQREHDPKKWPPVFGKDHAQDESSERDDSSKRHHPALKAEMAETPHTPDADEALAQEVRSWLAANWTGAAVDAAGLRQWLAKVVEARWAVPRWPVEWGGRALPDAQARIVERAFAAVGAPGTGQDRTNLWANTLLAFGQPALKQQLVPRLLRGDVGMCLLYSEPGAGSDLAGLRTRAERRQDAAHGDHFVVNGQKVWTSNAATAEYGMLVARTNWDVPKHQGLSFFFCPMKQPGIEVRPLRQITNESHFNEVFITDAIVPAENQLGELGQGWGVLQTALAYERSLMGEQARGPRSGAAESVGEEPLIALAREAGRLGDPLIRQDLARVVALKKLNALNTARAKADLAQGTSSPIMSLGKLAMSRILHEEARLRTAMLGPQSLLEGADHPRAEDANFLSLNAYFTSIGGGTDQIQRNIIGERVLGLPKEPEVDRDVPFRQVRGG